jgi:mRNA interferase MazF
MVMRGDLVTIALSGDYGKPGPALVVQADAFDALTSVTVLRLTSELHDWPLFRITIEAAQSTGLQRRSQVMIDNAATVPRSRIGQRSVALIAPRCGPSARRWRNSSGSTDQEE